MSRDPALAELLDDLRHDLAKYLSLPLRMLPRDAGSAAVRAALIDALRHTHRSGRETTSARELYARSRARLVQAQASPARLRALDAAVATALAWEAALDRDEPLERAQIEAELAAVGAQIDAWLDEVAGG
jgi:hypothetical protein